jgi:CheY-like chemotaxis protein
MIRFPGRRVLVLEDEVLLAIEAAETLEDLGAVVVGPVHRIDDALGLVAGEALDAALLDVNIGGRSSREVAERLRARGVPIVFATGYGARADVLPGCPVLDKPYSRSQVAAALTLALVSADNVGR